MSPKTAISYLLCRLKPEGVKAPGTVVTHSRDAGGGLTRRPL
jgi:hypothetical protein